MVIEALEAERVARSKRAFTTRRVGAENMQSLIYGVVSPASGDLVLARVDEIRKHKRLELTDGRKALMFPGDEIVVCFGNRYAPDQYEAVIGFDLSSCDLVAAGGVAAREVCRNLRMIEPTRITPIGIVGDGAGNRLNLRNFSVPDQNDAPPIPTILSVGTSMNAGKTLTATSLVRGLKAAGYRIAAIKATGTGSGNDVWIVKDAGADVVLDFTDSGFSGTYLIPQPEIEAATRRLINHAAWLGCDLAVIEIADGLQHMETAALIEAKHLWSNNLGVVFAAYDAMGAKCGVDLLQALGHRVLALSGRIALSPLAMREAQRATGLRVYTPWELQEGALVDSIFEASRRIALRPMTWLAANGARTGTNGMPSKMATDVHQAHEATGNSAAIELRVPEAYSVNEALGDLLRGQLGFAAEWVMALDMVALCNAAPGARSAERTNRRNGYRRRRWKTYLGDIEVRVPRLRRGGYRPAFLTGSALDSGDMKFLVLQALAPGRTPSSLGWLLKEMGVTGLSEQEIATLGAGLDPMVRINGDHSLANKVHPIPDKHLNGTDSRDSFMDGGGECRLVAAGQDDEDTDDDLPILPDPPVGEYCQPGDWQFASEANPRGEIAGVAPISLCQEFEED